MYQILHDRDGPLTAEEVSIARGKTRMTPELVARYTKQNKKRQLSVS